MSLTGQLKQKNSPVRQFFEKHEDKSGMRWCLALHLQSAKPILPFSYEPELKTTYSFMGTATDYLLRYTIQGNKLCFEDSFAYKPIKSRSTLIDWEAERIIRPDFFQALFNIGKFYLDGRDAVDEQSVYSALALAVLEHYYRSGCLPKILLSPTSKEEEAWINGLDGKNLDHKTAWYFFDVFYQSLGGCLFAKETAKLVMLFANTLSDRNSNLYKASLWGGGQSLVNSKLVGGADIDCIIECDGRYVLTDIKTSLEPLSITNLQQLLGYSLLYDPDKDDFEFSDIGFYHSRSASFRFLPLEQVVKECLPSFASIKHAREVFVSEIKQSSQMAF